MFSGKTETTFPATSEQVRSPSQISAHLPFNYLNNPINTGNQKISSPAKSASISEISTQLQHQMQQHQNFGDRPGGMMIYYSPDAGCMSDSSNSKVPSETDRSRTEQYRNNSDSGVNSSEHVNNSSYFAKRPMSFMKALEMNDKLEPTSNNNTTQQNVSTYSNDDSRYSQYEMNYEISV